MDCECVTLTSIFSMALSCFAAGMLFGYIFYVIFLPWILKIEE